MDEIGLITSSFGRNFIIEYQNNSYNATTKSKNTEYVVGDLVKIEIINEYQARIITIYNRDNLIFRSDNNKTKIIASNITQLIIVIAVKPNFNINLLNSFLLHAEYLSIKPLIIINKIELNESINFANNINNLYQKIIGYNVITISAIGNCEKLKPLLTNHTSLLIGQSGVGKSTIINNLIINANTRTNDLAKSEKTGQHTTTNATLYSINESSKIIDCPGLQDFGLHHLKDIDILSLMPDFNKYINQCKFRNCKHINEPNCSVINGFKNQEIEKSRFNFLQNIIKNLYNINSN
jgi:ribosome biogenesis GTPase